MSDGSQSLKVDREIRTLRGLALEKLRYAIVSMQFKPGDRLVERTLVEQLGVSRTVVREVLRHLETEGLVESIPHQGPIVARLTDSIAEQIYDLRSILEAAAARACAERATDADFARLGVALEEIQAGYERHDIKQILDATTRFYEVMFLSGGKDVAWGIVQTLNARITYLRAMTISSAGRNKKGPEEMAQILAALRLRDADQAEATCLAHVKKAGEIALKVLHQEIPMNQEMTIPS
ncbi:GntR family transcriptional regulator [Azospirillum sp. TSO35-2]|uniref:GntR family transcriptional regulator n=1 Tax=Azospirillum sp. TSO35-2 TaxID=716796 RepID=UPI000D621865|nr:GntR family transcriptional regulator [Azospirillum sp. TSO35-2]PWC37622.1 GntR family transcriptional regulator [Azospirillum sp. TSO35-2]